MEYRDVSLKPTPGPGASKEPVNSEPQKPSTSSALKPEKPLQKPQPKPIERPEPPKEIKKEQPTPKKSPEETKKSPAKHKGGVKNAKPVAKGAITSFFNKKPAGAKVEEPKKEVKKEPVEIKKEPVEVKKKSPPAKKEPEIQKKRALEGNYSIYFKYFEITFKFHAISVSSDEEIPATPEPPAKTKKNQKKLKYKKESNKRSRIMQIEDSSESEQESLDEPEKKLIKFDRELTPDVEEANVEPVKEEKPVTAEKKKNKAKRTVTRTYEDEDGFISKSHW